MIVVDSYSKDKTRDIALSFGARVIDCRGKLLEARYLGLKESKGDYVALIDTDQVLKPDTIEKAVGLMDKYDMLVFEEKSYNNWLIPKLYSASKEVINRRFDQSYAFDPIKGGIQRGF